MMDRGNAADHRLTVGRQWVTSGGSLLLHGPNGAALTAAASDIIAQLPGRRRTLRAVAIGIPVLGMPSLAALFGQVTGADLVDLDVAELQTLLAICGQVPGGTAYRGQPPVASAAVLALIGALSRRRALLLFLDQVQRIDVRSAAVFEFLASHLDGAMAQMLLGEEVPDNAVPARIQLCAFPTLLTRIARPAAAAARRRCGAIPTSHGPR